MICELLTNFEMAFSGGEGIRTLDTLSSIHTFQACQFNHSCTPPEGCENTTKTPKGINDSRFKDRPIRRPKTAKNLQPPVHSLSPGPKAKPRRS